MGKEKERDISPKGVSHMATLDRNTLVREAGVKVPFVSRHAASPRL